MFFVDTNMLRTKSLEKGWYSYKQKISVLFVDKAIKH